MGKKKRKETGRPASKKQNRNRFNVMTLARGKKKSQRQAGHPAENKIEIDLVSCNGPGAREKFFDPIQAGQSAENEIEIALVSCTGSGSRAVQAKTK